jgi:hypothetical protein
MAARPATRVVRERPAESAQPRPAVRDLSRGPASFRIDWDVRPAFDFVFSLWDDAGETEDLPAADREWLATTKGSMPADVAAKFKRLFESGICMHVAVIAVDKPDIRTAADLVTAVEATSYKDVIRGTLEGITTSRS